MLTAGDLDERIRIEEMTITKDANGAAVKTWGVVEPVVWAKVEEILPSKGENLVGELRISQRPTKIRIRYMDGLTSAMRLVLMDRDNRVVKITATPVRLGRREWLEIMAVDFSATGDAS